MHVTIDVWFTISKTIPLAIFAEFLTEQICGEKHARGNGDQRFQRAGTDTRTAVTTASEHEFTPPTSKIRSIL